MAIPSKLYKYQAIDNRAKPKESHSLENLRKHQVWLTKPFHFNDPFDCSIPFKLTEPSDTEWRLLMSRTSRDKQFIDELKQKNIDPKIYYDENLRPTEHAKRMVYMGSELKSREWVESPKKHGVACFTIRPDNALMWSHYADKHQGFCLEFDTGHSPFKLRGSRIHRVKYSDKYPQLSLSEFYLARQPAPYTALLLLTTKSTYWSYEQEWRLLDVQGDCGVKYVSKTLTGVYFGLKMSPEDKVLIERTLADAGFTGTKYQMKRSETEFRVEAEPIT